MADPYRTMPPITIGQRYSDPLGRTFTLREHRVLDDGAEQWLAHHDGGDAIWLTHSDVVQCDRMRASDT